MKRARHIWLATAFAATGVAGLVAISIWMRPTEEHDEVNLSMQAALSTDEYYCICETAWGQLTTTCCTVSVWKSHEDCYDFCDGPASRSSAARAPQQIKRCVPIAGGCVCTGGNDDWEPDMIEAPSPTVTPTPTPAPSHVRSSKAPSASAAPTSMPFEISTWIFCC